MKIKMASSALFKKKLLPSLIVSSCLFGVSGIALADNGQVTVTDILCNKEVDTSASDVAMFSPFNLGIGSWSHVVQSPAEFSGVHFPTDGSLNPYEINTVKIGGTSACSTDDVIKTILVKKYGNWDHQHGNGLSYAFNNGETFGKFKDIVLDIKLNSDETYINHQEYLDTYDEFLSVDKLEEIDQGKFNLKFVMEGQALPGQENLPENQQTTFRGSVNITLDQAEYSDKWLRIVIPAESLEYYTERDYAKQETGLDVADYAGFLIKQMVVTSETGNSLVLRNYLPDYESANVPESFKEEGVSIHNLYFRMNEEAPGNSDPADPVDDGSAGSGNDAVMPIHYTQMDSCTETAEDHALIVYNQSIDHLSNDDIHQDEGNFETHSWSKIYKNWDTTPSSATVFHSVKDDYSVKLDSIVADDDCADLEVMKTVLVKKYSNWDSQHLSGLDYRFPAEGLTFNDLKEIVLEFKFNSETTYIPSHEELVNTYKDLFTEASINELDQSHINLNVLLFSDKFDDQAVETLVGSVMLDLDPANVEIKDQWLRAVIPADALTFVTQKDWSDTDVEINEHLNTNLIGFAIHPETKNGKVLRNYDDKANFEQVVPELYKEMGISVRKVAIRLNGDVDNGDSGNDGDSTDTGSDNNPDNGTNTDNGDNTENASTDKVIDVEVGTTGGVLMLLTGLLGLRSRSLKVVRTH